ncbi:MAG: rhodanese-like domain-containing protein [Planctomycetota bacterium]|nr:rhodanese-like domain-containing protein [Planctomycetota bacterium]
MAKGHGERFVRIVDTVRPQVTEFTVSDVVAWQKNGVQFVLVDVREDREFSSARIPGAMHIGKGVIERDIEEKIPDTATSIVLYCGGGFRSALAALNLQEMGYTNVISMDGGFRGWKEAGLEVDSAPVV